MIDAYRPRLVVSAGFAGGLDPRLRRHDLVVATSLVNALGGEALSTRPRWSRGWMKYRIFIVDGCSPSIAWSAFARRSNNWAASTMPWRSTWRLLPWPRSAANGPLIFLQFERSATQSRMSSRQILENCLLRSRLPANLAQRWDRFSASRRREGLFNLHQNALASPAAWPSSWAWSIRRIG